MNEFIKKNLELIKELSEEELLEIILTPRRHHYLEETHNYGRKRITLGRLVEIARPDVIDKYKLLIEDEESDNYY